MNLLEGPGKLTMPTGETLGIRLLREDDAARLGAYLTGLSMETRAVWGPHAFDQPTADTICAAVPAGESLRFVVTQGEGAAERFLAYFILKVGTLESDCERYAGYGQPLDPSGDVTLAPSVSDAWQSRGLGNRIMPFVLATARAMGRRRVVLWGGVRTINARARAFYTRWGFREIGLFADGADRDMLLTLA